MLLKRFPVLNARGSFLRKDHLSRKMRLQNAKPIHYIVGAVLVVFILWFLVHPQSTTPDIYISNSDLQPGVIQRFRECVETGYDKSSTDTEYFKYFEDCLQDLPRTQVDAFNMGRFGEKKIFLPMRSGYDQSNCVWVTVGIGGDDLVEKMFKERYPGCKLFGVEASPDQYAGFEKYGTVIPHGVGKFLGDFI